MSKVLSEREQYIAECMTTGKSREDCEKLWEHARDLTETDKTVKEQPDVVKRIADLERINELQKEKIKKLESQLEEGVDVIKGVQKEREASDEQERQHLIYKISRDSKGFLPQVHLSNLNLHDLRLINNTFKTENAQDYLAYFQRRRSEELAGKRRKGLSVGEYDEKTKTWKDT